MSPQLLTAQVIDATDHYMSPGVLGAHNGGTDFNDIVHPAARCFVEGLFGLRPDVPNRLVEIAPQIPSAWDNASVATPALIVNASGFRQAAYSALSPENPSQGTTSVAVALNHAMQCPGCELRVHLPLRAVQLTGVTVDGVASTNFTVEEGFGQAVVVVRTQVAERPMVPVVVSLTYKDPIGYKPAVKIAANAGDNVALFETPCKSNVFWSCGPQCR